MQSTDLNTSKTIHLLCNLIESASTLADEEQNWNICKWAEHELHGYGEHDLLPEYRQLPCENIGHFVDVYDGTPHTAAIPMETLSEGDRAELSYWRLTEPLRKLLEEVPDDHCQQYWPCSLLDKYATELLPGYRCQRALRRAREPMQKCLLDGIKLQLHSYLQEHHWKRLAQLHKEQPMEVAELLNLLQTGKDASGKP